MGWRRATLIALLVLVLPLVLATLALLVMTQTDFGRERVRRFVVGWLNENTGGIARIGGLEGNLLGRVTLTNVSIRDSAGAPFVSVERASVRYDLGALFSQRIVIDSLRLEHPVIVIARPPGGEWNWRRILAGDTTTSDTVPGWGDWIALHNIAMLDGRVVVRFPWQPDSELGGAERDTAIAEVLGGDSRLQVVRVPGGYQQVMEFHDIHARLPRLRFADPVNTVKLAEVATLRMIALPFRPPAAEVGDLAGRFLIGDDSVWWRGARVAFPGSRFVQWDGAYHFADQTAAWLSAHGQPVTLADLRWVYPHLPPSGRGVLDFHMRYHDGVGTYTARDASVRVDDALLAGDVSVTMGDTLRVHDSDLRFRALDTRLLEQLSPGLEIPERGELSGWMALEGTQRALRVNGDVTFDGVRSGVSRVHAKGEVGFTEGFRARDLELRFNPLQVDLTQAFGDSLPIGGSIAGEAVVSGSTETRLAATADLVHRDRGARSRLVGAGAVEMTGRRRVDVGVRAMPLSLATAGRFVPRVRLRGSATGIFRTTGTLGDAAVRAALRLPDGGSVLARGTLDLASKQPAYDVAAELRVFNLRSVVAGAPTTSLTAKATARGSGVEPRTMRAVLAADVSQSAVDSIAFDLAQLRVAVEHGVVTVDSLLVRTPSARAQVRGAFGLVEDRNGTLTYRVAVDSLRVFGRWIGRPADTGVVRPSRARVADALARARADSARLAELTEIERLVIGTPAPRLEVDTVGLALRRDSLAGSIRTAGEVRGNVAGFDVRGRASLADLVARGNAVQRGRVEYAWRNAATPAHTIVVAAALDSVQTAGFALDNVDARVSYRQPDGQGQLQLAVRQDRHHEYRARTAFALGVDSNVVRFDELFLRFDTTRWVSTEPSTVRWGRGGFAVEALELRNASGLGRIYIDGGLLADGASDLDVDVAGLQLGHVLELVQGDVDAGGLLVLSGRATGTLRDPRFRGAAGVAGGSYGGKPLPDLRATFQYADTRLSTHTELLREGNRVAAADALLPVNLAATGVSGPRMLDAPFALDIAVDSVPLDLLPTFTDAVTNVRGIALGQVAVRGTTEEPAVAGEFTVGLESLGVAAAGVTLRNVTGAVRMRGDRLAVDSLIGYSGGGAIQMGGSVDMTKLREPAFDLRLTARDALVLDNEHGRLRADADIAVRGPFQRVAVTGDAAIRGGIIYPPEPEGDVIDPSDPSVFAVLDTSEALLAVLPEESEFRRNLRVDVDLRVSRDTWVRSPNANVEIFGDLDILLDPRRRALTLEGTVNTDRGEYTFLGRRFLLTRGSATFIGGPEINPSLQIVGEHDIQIPGREALAVRVLIRGTMLQPRITLETEAQPPIPQSDLISYLAFGRPSSSLLQFEGSTLSGSGSVSGGLVGGVAALATRQLTTVALGALTDEVESGLGRELGTDVLNITPAPLPPDLSQLGLPTLLRSTEVEAGKYFARRTFIAVQVRPTLVNPGVRLVHRMPKGFRVEASLEPRFRLRQPSLRTEQDADAVAVVGGFLVRQWRF